MPSGLRFFTPQQVAAVSRVMSPSRPAAQALVPQWDSKHPKWGGSALAYGASYINFWTLKIHEQMKQIRIATDEGPKFSGLGKRVAADPQSQFKIKAWLRNTFNGPMTFLKDLLAKYAPNVAPVHPGEFTWDLTGTNWIGQLACVDYLNKICMDSTGRPYDFMAGECSVPGWYEPAPPSGVLGALPAVQRARPALGFYRARPALAITTWDSEHPDWPGSWIAFWSLKIQEAFANGVRMAFSDYDISPLGKRVSQDPDLQVKLIAWLRSNYNFPSTFVDAAWDEQLHQIVRFTADVPPAPASYELGWRSPKTWDLARVGAELYLSTICRNSTGYGYNRSTGECYRPGDSYPQYVVG